MENWHVVGRWLTICRYTYGMYMYIFVVYNLNIFYLKCILYFFKDDILITCTMRYPTVYNVYRCGCEDTSSYHIWWWMEQSVLHYYCNIFILFSFYIYFFFCYTYNIKMWLNVEGMNGIKCEFKRVYNIKFFWYFFHYTRIYAYVVFF